MSFRPSRVRAGEWVLGAASLALLVSLFALPWYGLTSVYAPTASTLGARTSSTGWQSLELLRILTVIVTVIGVLAWWWQATRPAPALPVCATGLAMIGGAVLVVALIIRVFIALPENSSFIEAKSGAYVGLGLAVALFLGAYGSMREDGIDAADGPQEIETLRLRRGQAAPGRA